MNKKFLTFLILVMLVSIAAVSAHDNQTLSSTGEDVNLKAVEVKDNLSQADSGEKLEKTYFNDYDTKKQYDDNRVITHNVVKYYGDKDTRFTVEVRDNDGNPVKGAEISYSIIGGGESHKSTNSKGIASFTIKDRLGKFHPNIMVQLKGVNGDWTVENTIKVKSTIISKDLVKFSTSKKKFQIGFLDTKGNPLKNKKVKLKINGKTYKLRTNSKGIVKIKSTRFDIGRHKITAYNPRSGEERSLPVVVLKKGTHKTSVKVVNSKDVVSHKKLKNGDHIGTAYDGTARGAEKVIHIYISGPSKLGDSKHTKVTKVKLYFKNKKTGKVISKSPRKINSDSIQMKALNGYAPLKVSVWYKDKK